MTRLMEANSRYTLLQEIQNDIVWTRTLFSKDGAVQLKMDRRQSELDAKMAEVEAEFQELAIIANQN